MKKLLYIILSYIPAFANAQLWQPLDEGVSCEEEMGINTAINNMYYDSILNRLEVVGRFRYDGNCEENRGFAFWNGENWSNYPNSCSLPPSSMITFQGEKYASGRIVCASWNSEVCKLNENSWSLMESIPPILSTSLLKSVDGHLYIGTMLSEDENGEVPLLLEYFPSEDNYTIIAKKTGWELVNFEELLVYKDSLFIGGKFDSNQPGQADNRMNNLAKISGNSIEKVGQGMNPNSNTYSMCVHRDTLFIGGIFGSENFPGFTNEPYVYLIYYHNGEIKPYPIQANAYVSTMVSHNDILYLGGWFTQLGDEMCYGVGAFINSEVISLNEEIMFRANSSEVVAFMESVNKLLVIDDHLYMAGVFEQIGQSGPYGNIAKLSTPLSEFRKIVEDKVDWEMRLYPNPANEYITLEIPLGAQGTLQIFNNLGQLVRQEKISQIKTDISISNLTSGAYHCVFKTPNNTSSKRIIVR